MIRRKSGRIKPPVDDMEVIWTPEEKALVQSRLGGSVIGNADTVRKGLEEFVERTQADELMISGMFYEQSDRLRSFEIIAGLQGRIGISAEA
jgi:alkanesulfonate monooxygenase SsuD/methylene tetrahydromethanopterin reductase-like flavin-dependent oxidoreductase (luciferase family)